MSILTSQILAAKLLVLILKFLRFSVKGFLYVFVLTTFAATVFAGIWLGFEGVSLILSSVGSMMQ